MLIDRFLNRYHFSEIHAEVIHADANSVFALVDKLDFSRSRTIRLLFWLRGMGRMKSRSGLLQDGFVELARSQDEIVIGLIGQFWRSDGNLQKFKPEEFSSFNRPKFLKAVWNFRLTQNQNKCTLTTETRVYCTDEESRKRFSVYWFFVKPFSGLIRKEMLRSIKRSAESSTAMDKKVIHEKF